MTHHKKLIATGWDIAACGCWEFRGARMIKGYGSVSFRGKPKLAHRVAMEIATGESIPDGINVLHHCDNPPCVNPGHLFLGTQADNVMDMTAKGRGAKLAGENNGRSVLTAAAVAEILSNRSVRGSAAALAKKFGVKVNAISKVRRGLSWRHIARF